MPRASESARGLLFFGTDDEVRLGDRIRVRTFFVLKLEGVVCYIPGVSPKHKDMEYAGLRHVGIQLRNGEVRKIHWVAGRSSLGKRVSRLETGQPYKPLSLEERLDPTDLDEGEDEPEEKPR